MNGEELLKILEDNYGYTFPENDEKEWLKEFAEDIYNYITLETS